MENLKKNKKVLKLYLIKFVVNNKQKVLIKIDTVVIPHQRCGFTSDRIIALSNIITTA